MTIYDAEYDEYSSEPVQRFRVSPGESITSEALHAWADESYRSRGMHKIPAIRLKAVDHVRYSTL